MNTPRRLLLVLLLCGVDSFSQDLCDIQSKASGFSAPLSSDAYAVLDAIGKVVPFNTRTIRLFPSSDSLVKQRGGAAAQLCGQYSNERWIFFDPTYIDGIKGQSNLARYFVLAHEAAHHINGDTLVGTEWNRDQELRADFSAAVWLARLGVTKKQLLLTFDALKFPVESMNGYPTREERRQAILQAVDDASPKMNVIPPPAATPRRATGTGTLVISSDLVLPRTEEMKPVVLKLGELKFEKGGRIVTNGNVLRISADIISSDGGQIVSFLPNQNTPKDAAPGRPGLNGDDGGQVEITATKLVGSLSVRLSGMSGGPGGRGIDGTPGAAGLRGSDGVDGLFDCRSGGGDGGRGGNGTSGGQGVQGGAAGNGGTLILKGPVKSTHDIIFSAPPGQPGPGGDGGAGGGAGAGGQGGSGSGKCGGGHPGPNGVPGSVGPAGPHGAEGHQGLRRTDVADYHPPDGRFLAGLRAGFSTKRGSEESDDGQYWFGINGIITY